MKKHTTLPHVVPASHRPSCCRRILIEQKTKPVMHSNRTVRSSSSASSNRTQIPSSLAPPSCGRCCARRRTPAVSISVIFRPNIFRKSISQRRIKHTKQELLFLFSHNNTHHEFGIDRIVSCALWCSRVSTNSKAKPHLPGIGETRTRSYCSTRLTKLDLPTFGLYCCDNNQSLIHESRIN